MEVKMVLERIRKPSIQLASGSKTYFSYNRNFGTLTLRMLTCELLRTGLVRKESELSRKNLSKTTAAYLSGLRRASWEVLNTVG
jgi:hypothetical protein